MNNWTKIGCFFLGLGATMFFLAIFEFISIFTYLTTRALNPISSSMATSAAISVSFPIAILAALDCLVGIVGYAGRPSFLRKRLDNLGSVVNDSFSVLTKRLLGILGAIIAFLSIALPWWTSSEWGSSWRGVYDKTLTIYLYQATMTRLGVFSIVNITIWYGWVALVLVLIGGVFGMMGSLARGTRARNIVFAGGLLTLLSAQAFMVGFQYELYNLPYTIHQEQVPVAGWFSLGFGGHSMFAEHNMFADVTYYLTFGFWLALIAGIFMLIAAAPTNPETVPEKPILPSPA